MPDRDPTSQPDDSFNSFDEKEESSPRYASWSRREESSPRYVSNLRTVNVVVRRRISVWRASRQPSLLLKLLEGHVARTTSDLSVLSRGRAGKLGRSGLTKLNRLRGAREAKGPPPRLRREIRAQGSVTPRRDTRDHRVQHRAATGVPRVYPE